MICQGAAAVKNGKHLENIVADVIESKFGVRVVNNREWLSDSDDNTESILLRNVGYKNIYGGGGRGEFVFVLDGSPIRIECRCQKTAGSADEKVPCLLLNCVAFDEDVVILVVDGDGFKKGAKDWLRKSVDEFNASQEMRKAMCVLAGVNRLDRCDKYIRVMNVDEFYSWASETARLRCEEKTIN